MNIVDDIPNTGWVMCDTLPNLDGVTSIAIDTETTEHRDLKKWGPGWATDQVSVVSIIVATNDACWYLPVGHEMGFNHDIYTVTKWLAHHVKHMRHVIGANLRYDAGNLSRYGVTISGDQWEDVLLAEHVLDEHAMISLDYVSGKYLGTLKTTEFAYEWSAARFGGKADRKQILNVGKGPAEVWAHYGIGDGRNTYDVWLKQQLALKKDRVHDHYRLCCELEPILLDMQRLGIRVDLEAAQKLSDELAVELQQIETSLGGIRIHAASDLYKLAQQRGLADLVGTTPTGAPSFRSDWLAAHMPDIRQARLLARLKGTFVDGYVLGAAVNGRIHASPNQIKAITGRLAYAKPNLQNIPARHPFWGPKIRALFLPEEGMDLLSADYSQVEFMIGAHVVEGPGAVGLRRAFKENRGIDFHQQVADLCSISRNHAKGVNFGLSYGMGKPKLAKQLGVSMIEAEKIFDQYHSALPCIRQTVDAFARKAMQHRFIETWGGRKCRFNLFQPKGMRVDKPLPYDQALLKWGHDGAKPGAGGGYHLEVAFAYKAYNSFCQGSGAAILKDRMVALAKAGLLGVVKLHLSVHDELVMSIPKTGQKGLIEQLTAVMTTLDPPLRVPLSLGVEVGESWGAMDLPERDLEEDSEE